MNPGRPKPHLVHVEAKKSVIVSSTRTAAEAKPSSADEALTAALHRLYEVYGANLAEYFRDVSPAPAEEHRTELPVFVDQRRFANRR